MATVLLVFCDVSFSYALLDKGIAQAKEHDADLTVLFLHDEHPGGEGYGFPSDINNVETLSDSADAHNDDVNILLGKIRLLQNRARAEQIACTIQVSSDLSEEAILSAAGDAILILVDAGTADEPANSELRFSPAKLAEQATCPVELVKNQ